MNVLVGVTGSVATTLLSKLIQALVRSGHEVQVVATRSSLYFFDPHSLGVRVWQETDEWPGEGYAKGQMIAHIQLRRWTDVFVVAPVSANTLAKFAHGLSDNLLTSVFRAWDFSKPVVLAPAMNTLMWEHPFTRRHIAFLGELEDQGLRLMIVPPVKKTLACADTGVGAMAALEDIVQAVDRLI